MTNYSLKIADYIIFFNAMTEGMSFSPSASQQAFITTDTDFDLAVNVSAGPVIIKKEAEPVFSAPYVEEVNGSMVKKNDRFWTVYRLGRYILVQTTCPRSQSCKEALLVIRPQEKSWDLIIDGPPALTDPMCYPVDGLLLYYLTALNKDIFIHGSGIRLDERGYLFTGPSGKGKTTIAGLFRDRGAEVMHDDRLILRKKDNKIFMYNTPVYHDEKPAAAQLSSLYIISHGSHNKSTEMSHTEAMTAVMANCIQHHWNIDLIENLTEAILALVNTVDIKKLEFVPDSTVVSFIRNDEQ